jgi:transposase
MYHQQKGRPPMKITLIAIDTSKHLFTICGIDAAGKPVLRRNLARHQVEPFFSKQAPTVVVLEACGASHHWGRVLSKLGHTVKLLPAQHAKPFVKRSKTDRADALAISEAARRPDIHFVPVKSAEEQAASMVLTLYRSLVRQRTNMINALRGHAAEFGIIAAKGCSNVSKLLERIDAEPGLPERMRQCCATLARQITRLDEEIDELYRELLAMHQANPVSRLLATVPGVGPVTAIHFALQVDPKRFASGRHLAAWLGGVPKENSTAGRQHLGKITRAGSPHLRSLLVLGATSVVRLVRAKPDHAFATPWLKGLLERRPAKLVAVALANKMARIIWAMLSTGEAYRPNTATA